jgi:hypothetical protein
MKNTPSEFGEKIEANVCLNGRRGACEHKTQTLGRHISCFGKDGSRAVKIKNQQIYSWREKSGSWASVLLKPPYKQRILWRWSRTICGARQHGPQRLGRCTTNRSPRLGPHRSMVMQDRECRLCFTDRRIDTLRNQQTKGDYTQFG